MKFKVIINENKCTECLECFEACTGDALALNDVLGIVHHSENCQNCESCMNICPEDAIEIKVSL